MTLTLSDQLREVFEDFERDHPAWDRLNAFEGQVDQHTRLILAHIVDHWRGDVPEENPTVQAYTMAMLGFLLGTEFAKRGYTLDAEVAE